jgi:hypothetical protein
VGRTLFRRIFDGMTWDEIRAWKRKQRENGMHRIVQPRYEKPD